MFFQILNNVLITSQRTRAFKIQKERKSIIKVFSYDLNYIANILVIFIDTIVVCAKLIYSLKKKDC